MSIQEYTPTQEKIFKMDHPEVVSTTALFHAEVMSRQIFERFEITAGDQSYEKAVAVAGAWHAFSEFMPWFLCEASARVSNNRIRHYVIQTAFEELGMRREDEIHHEMFWSAAEEVGIGRNVRDRYSRDPKVMGALQMLRETILNTTSDAEILGLLLGLEMPAEENIDTVFFSMSYSEEAERRLGETHFFKIHKMIEIEHVRLTISNYLRFCGTDKRKAQYRTGFEAGTHFWDKFWTACGDLVLQEKRGGSTIARTA